MNGQKWKAAQYTKFRATMLAKKKNQVATVEEIPLSAIPTRAPVKLRRGRNVDLFIGFSRRSRAFVLVVDSTQFPFRIID